MEKLRKYLNALTPAEQDAFAAKCDTSVGYLRKAISLNQKLGDGLAIDLERHSGGKVSCEDVRPDVDWAFLRGRPRPRTSSRA